MAFDGIKILKVGPELTFAYRAALGILEKIEKDTLKTGLSGFSDTLKLSMMENNKYWKKYYKPEDDYAFEFSLLDRSRYYLTERNVQESINRLKLNIDSINTRGVFFKYVSDMMNADLCWIKSKAEYIIENALAKIVNKYEAAFGEV